MADGSTQAMWFAPSDLAGVAGMPGTERAVRNMADREGWECRARNGRGGGKEYALKSLPHATQTALILKHSPASLTSTTQHADERRKYARRGPNKYTEASIKSIWARFERVPQALKDVATKRQRTLLALEQLVANQMPLMDARELLAEQLRRDGEKGASAASIARLQKLVDGAHRSDWIALLVPHYVGRTATAEMPPEAWDIFKADWLRVETPTATGCYYRLQRIAKHNGWQIPCLKTFERRIERELPPQVITLARKGEEAVLKMYPAQQRDRSVFHALEAVNADGHRFDVFVRFPDGTIGRPMMVAWQDLYSGKMLSHRIGDNESSDLIRLAFADMVANYGIPAKAWLDNGRGFASKMLTGGSKTRYRFKVLPEDPSGVFVTMGVEVHWATPYHGQAKPIERAWRDLCDSIAKHPAFAGAYTGNNPMAKPENYGSKAIEFDEFARVVSEEISAHNARDGRRSKVCAGRSLDVAFNASYAVSTIRKATDEQQRLMLLAAEAVSSSRIDGSITLSGNRYWCESLSRYQGQKVVVRFDPMRLHGSVYVYALDATYIGEADCVAEVGFADTNAGRDHARARRDHRNAAKKLLSAERRLDASTVAAQIPSMPPENLPSAAVISAVFGKHGPRPATPVETSEVTPLQRTGTDDGGRAEALSKMLERNERQRAQESL